MNKIDTVSRAVGQPHSPVPSLFQVGQEGMSEGSPGVQHYCKDVPDQSFLK